jgi:hypothetical protein
MRPLSWILVGFLTWGCAPRAEEFFAVPGRLFTGKYGAQPGYTVKLVRVKQAGAEVIGDDGSVCRLTAERFALVEVGDWLDCNWTIVPDTSTVIARVGA